MKKNQTDLKNITAEDSIDLIAILKKIWFDREIIGKVTTSFFLFGCIVVLISPVLYTSQTIFVPQISDDQETSVNKLGSLASLYGLNINSTEMTSDSYLSPLLYTQIIDSEEFSIELLSAELINSDSDKLTIGDYLSSDQTSFNFNPIGFIKKYTIGLFSKKESEKIKSDVFKNYNFISDKDYKLSRTLRKKFEIALNENEGFVKVSAKDKDAFISTQLVQQITKILQSKIIKLRTNKIKERLRFSKEQYDIKQIEFDALHKKLAEFKDSNKNISTATFLSELQKLESEYQLQQSILINLASEYNNNKIKLNKDTPIFSVLDEVSVPNENSHPKIILILFVYVFLGLLFSVGYVLSKKTVINLVKELRS